MMTSPAVGSGMEQQLTRRGDTILLRRTSGRHLDSNIRACFEVLMVLTMPIRAVWSTRGFPPHWNTPLPRSPSLPMQASSMEATPRCLS